MNTESDHLAAGVTSDVRGDTGRGAAESDPWSTNGTFVWLTSDRAIINARGDELAFEPPPLSGRKEREEICNRIVRAVNNHAALVSALTALVDNDESSRRLGDNGYAKGSPMWKTWQAARSALAAAKELK